jgi:hypothetical protein
MSTTTLGPSISNVVNESFAIVSTQQTNNRAFFSCSLDLCPKVVKVEKTQYTHVRVRGQFAIT